MAMGTRAYTLFGALRKAITLPNPSMFTCTVCISQEVWSHIDPRAVVKRDPVRYQLRLRRLIHIIRDKLRDNQSKRVKVTGREIEALLSSDPPPFQRKRGNI